MQSRAGAARADRRGDEDKASVEPGRAKPGDTVMLTVTARLDPGYPIDKSTRNR